MTLTVSRIATQIMYTISVGLQSGLGSQDKCLGSLSCDQVLVTYDPRMLHLLWIPWSSSANLPFPLCCVLFFLPLSPFCVYCVYGLTLSVCFRGEALLCFPPLYATGCCFPNTQGWRNPSVIAKSLRLPWCLTLLVVPCADAPSPETPYDEPRVVFTHEEKSVAIFVCPSTSSTQT